MPVKRAGGAPASAPKRTRFASPPPSAGSSSRARRARSDSADGGDITALDDQYLEADITESSRKTKDREKHLLRGTEGYDSDSSNDDEGVVPSRRPDAKKDDDDDDDVDMFGDGASDGDTKGKGKETDKGKAKEFMDLEEIEGQEFVRSVDDDEEYDSEDEDTRNKKRKAGLDGDMGVDITPFNMKSEMETGRFTADGEEYVENTGDPGDKHDSWLGSMDKEEIKKARRAHREREAKEREREAREAELEGGEAAEAKEQALLRQAVQLLQRGETILEGLQRLGKEVEDARKKDTKGTGGKKKSWAERQRERKAAMAVDEANPFARLSDVVSGLTAIGQLDVYALSREAIQRMLPREPPPGGGVAPAGGTVPSRPGPDTRQFQYRFSMAYIRALPEAQRPVEREVFGPFPYMQLRGWKATGAFGPTCENIELQQVKPREGEGEGSWGRWEEVVDAKP